MWGRNYQESGEKGEMRSFAVCSLHQVKNDDTGRSHSTHGRDEEIVKESYIFWDTTPYSPLKVN
jgi:hypothetical protein